MCVCVGEWVGVGIGVVSHKHWRHSGPSGLHHAFQAVLLRGAAAPIFCHARPAPCRLFGGAGPQHEHGAAAPRRLAVGARRDGVLPALHDLPPLPQRGRRAAADEGWWARAAPWTCWCTQPCIGVHSARASASQACACAAPLQSRAPIPPPTPQHCTPHHHQPCTPTPTANTQPIRQPWTHTACCLLLAGHVPGAGCGAAGAALWRELQPDAARRRRQLEGGIPVQWRLAGVDSWHCPAVLRLAASPTSALSARWRPVQSPQPAAAKHWRCKALRLWAWHQRRSFV